MKDVIKDAEEKSKRAAGNVGEKQEAGVIRSRTIPPAVVAHFVAKTISLEQHVSEVMDAEAVARIDRIAEMEFMRAQNIIEHNDEIKSRPQKEWFASTKEVISSKQAAKEKQQRHEEKIGTGTHRMTRKKRRAQEARQMLKEAQEEMRAEDEESGKQSNIFTENTMKSSARATRNQDAQRAKEIENMSVHDTDMQQEKKKKQKQKLKKRKPNRDADASGDGDLFSDEQITYATKKTKKGDDAPQKSSYPDVQEYDPDKKKTTKKSVKSFKSKSKYKRR